MHCYSTKFGRSIDLGASKEERWAITKISRE